RPMLREAEGVLEARRSLGSPIYATITTTSSHFPWSEVPEAPLPPEVYSTLSGADAEYRGYLGRLHYLDLALGEFLDRLFASPLGGTTLVVVMGDHSTIARPPAEQTIVQQTETHFRIA